MTPYKAAYRRALEMVPGRLHFAAHSHALWPDCSRDAQLQAWDDAVRFLDDKWDHIGSVVLPEARGHIARLLRLPNAASLALAPSTHEFVARLFSCFDFARGLRVVTTDGEFHSFARQAARLEEIPGLVFDRVPVEPFATFEERFARAVAAASPDLVFLSQVFFRSGFRPNLAAIAAAVPAKSVFVVDGYHGFCAVPTDWSAWASRAFYTAGGYKYAQSGEGGCFLHVPAGTALRPWNTGWWADFGHLEEGAPGVQYAAGGDRFAGATWDPTVWYRFNAVQRNWETAGLTVESAHQYTTRLAEKFLSLAVKPFDEAALWSPRDAEKRGAFLAFRLPSSPAAGDWVARLRKANVMVDRREDVVRIGFALYQDEADITELAARISRVR